VSSPRNKQVADALNKAGFATLLADLLGPEEKRSDARTFEYRFNIPLLSERLSKIIHWARENETTSQLQVGLLATSTGAAAALTAVTTSEGSRAKAIVSRGGRPDLVKPEVLSIVHTPTVFIVGGKDRSVLAWTRDAFENLRMLGEKDIVVIPEAGHLFEEPGALERVSDLAVDWFGKYIVSS
jgi:dienelactone hydrolase